MKSRSLRTLLIVTICLTFGYLVGFKAGTNKITYDLAHFRISVINKEPPQNSTIDFSQLWSVLDNLEQNYYDKSALNSQKLLNGAISGMVQSIADPYTIYLPPTQNSNFKQSLAGQFYGIGAELGTDQDKHIVVIAPLDGSPAAKAGIKTGDRIVTVDGQSIDSWTLEQAVNKIRGPKGTRVTLSVIHKGQANKNDISITRDTITVKSVNGWIKKVKNVQGITLPSSDAESSVAYIQLSQFGDATNQDWTTLINKLVPQIQSSNAKGVILDLRNNPGGYLTDAQYIASEFLNDNAVIVKEQAGDGEEQTLSVNRKGQLKDVPLIVLINGGSASASEIVSGALRDNSRAKLVGEKSFGKGTVQQAEDLGNGAGLHVTVAKWLTPNGTWVHGKGLIPDVTVNPDTKDPSHDTQLEKAVQVLVE